MQKNPGITGVFAIAFCVDRLETGYYRVFGQRPVDCELTNDLVVVASADDESRLDLSVSVLEEYGLGEVRISELLMVYYITVVVLDDQGELFGGGVVELYLEDNVVFGRTLVLNRYLLFGQGRNLFAVVPTFVGACCVAEENYYGGECCCDYMFSVHTIFLFVIYDVVD